MWCEQATPEAAHLLVSIFHLQLIAYFYDFANNSIFLCSSNEDALGCASVCDKLVTESFSSFLPLRKGWGLSVKLGKHSAIWGKLGTALQAYALNPCTKFPPNPTSRKVNT